MTRRKSPINYQKVLFLAAYLIFSFGLDGQTKLEIKICQLTSECFDYETYIYLPERNICVNVHNLDSIEISENEILNIESFGNYVYKSTLRELLNIDTSICENFPIYYDKNEISRRRSKVKYEAHSRKYNIPIYNCIENSKQTNLEINIHGFHAYRDKIIYYIEEETVYKISNNKNCTIIDLYEYKIENDVLLGSFQKSYQKKKFIKDNRSIREDDIEIEICWLNKDCSTHDISQLAASTAWYLYEVKNERKFKSIVSKIKRRERKKLKE